MYPLDCPIRAYAWGSRSVIAGLQGRPAPTAEPEAELWIGAHSTAPSMLPDGSTLAELIDSAPDRLLGSEAVRRFGPRLPYLLKFLAAEEPLSLQAHPDLEQARDGYAAGNPNYVDANHKPELLVAITPMAALCGFRRPRLSAELFAALGVDDLAPVVEALHEDDLRRATQTLLTWPAERRRDVVASAVRSAGALPGQDAAVVERLARAYPEDMGVLVALLLNHVALQPGEAIWMPAGNLHAYLHGAGIEVMAASDNVLRGGLTPKLVDVPELLRVVRFEPLDDPVVPAREDGPGVLAWPVPVDDFALRRVTVSGGTVTLTVPGPRTVLCVTGRVTLADEVGQVSLGAGESAFGGAAGGPMRITGSGEIYLASVGTDSAK